MSVGDAGESGLSGVAHDFLHIVQEGRSFSGREPHCCFLNLGGDRFADISAVSGFDLADDGRAAALVDWDHDGDLDVWISNRNAPQARLLLNQLPVGRHYVALRLQGSVANRDAIGARVELFVDAASDPPITRTLRAGDGFLAQSSKRLLFGLGDAARVDRVIVHWPGGPSERFAIPEVDRAYRLIQGRGESEACDTVRGTVVDLPAEPCVAPAEAGSTGSLCFSMIRLPVTDYLDFRDQPTAVVARDARLVLVNLWASWCQPCLLELADFAGNQQRLRERGIDIVALSVDAATASAAEPDADRQCLQQIQFPFRSGRADRSIVERLQLLSDTIFEVKVPLPIPTSFLIDRKGRVVAVYKGPVTVDQLLSDAAKLKVRTTDEWRSASLPFAGRWVMPPRQRHLFDLVDELADRGYFQECQQYLRENERMLTTHPRWPELARKISAGRPAE